MSSQDLEILRVFLNSPVLAKLVWALLIITILVIFKNEISELVKGIAEMEWLGGKLKWSKQRLTSPTDKEKMSRQAHIYWLGHDIMYTMDVIIRELGTAHIIHGFRVSIIHARAVQLDEYGDQLERLLSNLQAQSTALTREDRIKLLETLDDMRTQIGKQLNAAG